MPINTDGQKKQGRFLKKNSKILSSLTMVDYSFEEICNHPLVSFDNPERSIIHSKFHNKEALDEVIKEPSSINEKVYDPSVPQLGVIFPADFTQDWHNERLNSKRRALGFDDEDEIDFAEVARRGGKNAPKNDAAAVLAAQQQANSDTAHHSAQTTEAPIIAAETSSPASVRAPEVDGKVVTMNANDMSHAINKAFNPNSSSPAEEKSENDNASFTPLPTEPTQSTLSVEDRAIEAWKSKQMIAKQNEVLLDELRKEARSEGYQSGFREGEEKGVIAAQRSASQVFSKVTDIIKEFENLKGLILENVQKNFYELSQAIGEALLGREFSIRPEAYATMIQRVVKDTVSPNEFKVRMHPETWQKVHDLNITELEQHLVKDSSIPQGDFRIESSLTVVDVNAKKLVTQLLENADINLFDEKKAV
jgi:flagellar biosynthesis/type III secretory pathway protein FliH